MLYVSGSTNFTVSFDQTFAQSLVASASPGNFLSVLYSTFECFAKSQAMCHLTHRPLYFHYIWTFCSDGPYFLGRNMSDLYKVDQSITGH